ncbi:MAG TPA: hypothetical protein VFI31_23175 [Pirellulales bacterium]|nr:hypothetical protein [Pirellulales bacterium]
MSTASSTDLSDSRAGRRLAIAGVVVAVLGLAAYVVQIAAHRLIMPWYLPITATIGTLLIVVSLWQKRNVWRVLALMAVLLLTGAEWAFVLATRLPPYSGPVAVGQPFPSFTTLRVDGTKFTNADFLGDKTNVLVFFRGRW